MATQNFYLYRHIRLDTNEVFYVGIGTKPKYYKQYEVEFNRAYCKKDRNVIWKRIFNKCKNIHVEILFESDDRSYICKKEEELIALYKRIKDGGTLSNLSLGGEKAANGFKHTDEAKLKISEASKKRKGLPHNLSEKALSSLKERSSKKVILKNDISEQEFSSIKELCLHIDMSHRQVYRLIKFNKPTKTGFYITLK